MERSGFRPVARDMQPPLHLLVVDDDEQKRSLIARCLRIEFPEATVSLFESGAQAINHLTQNHVDAVITDHSMHPINGLELTQWVRGRFSSMPVMMVTGNPGVARDALKAGATLVVDFARFQDIGPTLRTLLARVG